MSTLIKSKTLLDLAKENKCVINGDLFKLIKGRKLRLTKTNRSGHAYPSKFIVKDMHPSHKAAKVRPNQSILFMIDNMNVFYHTNCYLSEMCLDIITVKELEEGIESLNKQLEDTKAEILICKELGIDEYDERLIKVIRSLGEIKKSKSKDKLKEAKEFLALIESE